MEIIQIEKNIILKQIQLEDAEVIFKTIDKQRKYLGKWLPFVEITKEVNNTKEFIKSLLKVSVEEREFVFVIYCEKEFAGIIGFKDTDRINRKTELGYWLSESFQKKGIITKSVVLLIDFAFNKLEMNRVQIKCATGNMPSKKIPKKLNFHFEGIERAGELLTGNTFTDLEVYSILRSDNTLKTRC